MQLSPLTPTAVPAEVPTIDSLQAAPKDQAGTAAAKADSGLSADVSLATSRAAGASPVSAAATFNTEVSLSGFLWAFKPGDKLDLDGPAWYNGSGKVEKLDEDHLKLNLSGKIGTGAITLDRKQGNTFTVSVNLDGKSFKMSMKAVRNGNKLTLSDVNDPSKKLIFTQDGKGINLNPDGLKIPGSIDIAKK
jgi:hypothetical protein